jgi:hypothetical protein
MTPPSGSRPPRTPDDGAERGDDRHRVQAAQPARLGGESFPEPLDGRLGRLDQQLAVIPADIEPEEVKALAEVDDLRLVLVESQAPGRQPSRQPRLDLPGLLLAVAEHDHIIGVPDRYRGTCHGFPGVDAGGLVTDPGGLLQPVQRDVQEAR